MSAIALYLTDTHLFFYKEGKQHSSFPTNAFEEAERTLSPYFSPSLSLILDSEWTQIQETPLPPLPLWDYGRLLLHKRAMFSKNKGFGAFSFFRSEKQWILRSTCFLQTNPLYFWIERADRAKAKIFLPPLEAFSYLKTHALTKAPFLLLLYPLPSQGWRVYAYKSKQFLLSRHLQSDTEIPAILHFLSRNFPEIEENVEVVKIDFHSFLEFILSRKHPLLPTKPIIPCQTVLKRLGLGMSPILLGGWIGAEAYNAFWLYRELPLLREQKESLKSIALPSGSSSSEGSLTLLKEYLSVQQSIKNPLEDFQKLSELFGTYSLKLENIKWAFTNKVEILLTFWIPSLASTQTLDDFLEKLLKAFHQKFKNAEIYVISSPYKSSPQERFTSSSLSALPSMTLRLSFP